MLLTLLLAVLLLYCTILVVLFFTQRLLLFQWWRAPAYGDPPLEAEVFSQGRNSGPDLYAWVFPQTNPQAPWVVFFHGNYTTVDRQMDAVRGYLALGYSVVLPEYYGFRHLKGLPTRQKVRQHLIETLDQVAHQYNFQMNDTVFHCFSLGGVIGPDLLSHYQPRKVILEATVTCPKEFMKSLGVLPFILLDRYGNIPLLKKFPGPILVLSYLQDKVVSPKFAKLFRQHLPKAHHKQWKQGHNSIRSSDEAPAFWQEIHQFLTASKHG